MVKLKTLVFGSAFALAISACGERSGKEPVVRGRHANEQDLPRIKQEDEAMARKQNQEIRVFRQHVKDSVMNANGGVEYLAQLEANRPQQDDWFDIASLENQYSLGNVMTKKVFDSGLQIIDNAFREIVSELSKYQIILNDYIKINENDAYYLDGVVAESAIACYRYDMCFVGVGTQDPDFDGMAEYYWDNFQNLINIVIDNSSNELKNNAKRKVTQIIEKTKRKLITNRKNIERQYSPYYLLKEEDKIWLGFNVYDGKTIYGYSDLNTYANCRWLTARQNIAVRDSVTPAEFYDDFEDIKLVPRGKYKWQVIKETESGETAKSSVFSDSAEYVKYEISEQDGVYKGPYFRVESVSGKCTVIDYDEFISSKTHQDWTPKIPESVERQIDSLLQEIEAKNELRNLVREKTRAADSIADIMVQHHFGNRVR